MSSILKALRKVEDEKASMGQGGVDLAHDILKRGYEQPKRVIWPYWLLGGVFLLALGIAVWAIVKPGEIPNEISTTEKLITAPAEPKQSALQSDQQMQMAKLPDVSGAEPSNVEIDTERPIALSEEVPEQSEIPPVINLPDLRIDEIVYHESRASRLAVVNDLPVMEGTDIEGARVEEILPDRVRFSFEGVSFNKFVITE